MKAINENIRIVKIHAICWLTYIAYEVLVNGILTGSYSHFYYYLFFYVLNISLFYGHASVVMDASFRRPPYTLWMLPLLLLLEMALYIGVAIGVSQLLEIFHARRSPLVINKRFLTGTIWRGLLFILFSTGYYFLRQYLVKRKMEMQKELEFERLKVKLYSMEIDFLRSQINPHLLFNTLNFIKYASKHDPQQSDEAIIRLSEIMNFALERSEDGFVPLKDEIRQIENLVRLNQLRFGQQLHLQYEATVDDENVMILPIVLVTLVENVFKHGDLHHESEPAIITITCRESKIEFWSRNLVYQNDDMEATSEVGVHNAMLRLERAYGERFVFNFGRQGDFYVAYLRIFLG